MAILISFDNLKDMARSRYERAIVETIHSLSRPVVDSGAATLEEQENEGGRYLKLTPKNPQACKLSVYLDYPTLVLSVGTTELSGSEDDRLHTLALLVEAVIAGKYEWRVDKKRAFGVIPFRRFIGTFHTAEGPWTFSRLASDMETNGEQGTYAPFVGDTGTS